MTTLANLIDANWWIDNFGLPGILIIVFAESGLLIGFFLPGDSLLFTTGLLVAASGSADLSLDFPLWLVCLLVFAAAFLGDQAGYLFGRKVGPALFRRPDSKLFKQENVEKAHAFFERHGAKSILLARFVPIVRTFTPIIAGVSKMPYRLFTVFNAIGGLLWGCGVVIGGYFLGQIDFVADNVEAILVVIVLISVVPVVIEFLRARKKNQDVPDGNFGPAGGNIADPTGLDGAVPDGRSGGGAGVPVAGGDGGSPLPPPSTDRGRHRRR